LESRWRRNLFNIGLGDFGTGLAARTDGFFPPNYFIVQRPLLDPNILVRVPLDTEPDTPYDVIQRLRLRPHFPYGFAVEPDRPA